jgi:hypothetical protein
MRRDGSRKLGGPRGTASYNGVISRLVALGVFALSAGALVYVHREDLWPAAPLEDPAFARCFNANAARIGKMRSEGLINDAQATRFRDHAEARCRAQTGGASAAPPIPGAR